MESSVVVKVKYGDKLRRFNAAVNENRQLELDIEGLRAKIRSLFNFTADSELELTYEDEDQDIVALVDEEDLHDVLKQGLNPVRITVQINAGSSASVRSSGTSTPVLPAQPDIHSGVAELLKSVPEPFRGHLSKLSAEVASKTASSTPVLAEFIEGITKAGQSFLNAHIPPQSSPNNVAANKEASQSLNEPGKLVSASGNEREGSRSNYEEDMLHFNDKSCNDEIKRGITHLHTSVLGKTSTLRRAKEEAKRKHIRSVATPLYTFDMGTSSGKAIAVEAEMRPIGRTKEEAMRTTTTECPFSGLEMPPSSVAHKTKAFGSQGSVFHRGVQCDGCGILPITGPRFKSKVKVNYDLCHICFEQMGQDSDYTRIDVPDLYRHPWSFKGNPHVFHRHWSHAPPPPPMFGKHMKQCRPKLDSRFILDVNVMDGTVMAPKTPFTKIWRMRNNGNLPWIHGTQLLWIGGDKFSPTNSVEIEIPVSGFYPENEVDVAVDFIAPELPGRYISYWKMASSSGQKFGQRIWVLVQVDASLAEASSTPLNSLNLNLPPEGPEMVETPLEPLVDLDPLVQNQSRQIQMANPLNLANHEKKQGKLSLSEGTSKSLPETPKAPPSEMDFHTSERNQPFDSLNEQQNKQQNMTADPFGTMKIYEHLMGHPYNPTADVPTIQFQPPPAPVAAASCPPVEQTPVEANSEVEEVLLKELEQMGFKQVEMNRTLLRKNDYDFEKSLDELCNVSEWDLLLEEMRGMGFVDGEANKRVLEKNNGSLKHAVMDLITRENV